MRKTDVYGLGNPLIDILVHVDEDLLKEIGVTKGCMRLIDEQSVSSLEAKLVGKQMTVTAGGSCANTMVMLAQLGGCPAYSGKVGADALGADFGRDLEGMGVLPLLGEGDGGTGRTVILITPDAGRTMNTYLGACTKFSQFDVSKEAIEKCSMLYVEGYLWDTDSQKGAVTEALRLARAAGKPISLTLSDSFCVARHRDDFLRLVDRDVDLLFCNEDEAMALTGEKSLESAIKGVGDMVGHAVVTLGRHGAVVKKDGTTTKVPVNAVDAVDTTGAGDSFAAGYLYGTVKGWSPERAGRLASFVSSKIVSQVGPRFKGNLVAASAHAMDA